MTNQSIKLYAEIEAIKIEVQGMVAANKSSLIRSKCNAYSEEKFYEKAREIRAAASNLDPLFELDKIVK